MKHLFSFKSLALFFIVITFLITSILYFKNSKNPPRPNVIWFSIDTLRAKSLKAYGNSRETSPFLSEFGKKSIIFKNVIAQGPVTQVSHYSMLTGYYPNKHRVLLRTSTEQLSPQVKIAAEYFQQEGYFTFLAGSFHSGGPLDPAKGLNRGAESIIPYDLFITPKEKENALKILENETQKPIFAFIHTSMVHGPYLDFEHCQLQGPANYHGKMIWQKDPLIKAFEQQDNNKIQYGEKSYSYLDYFFALVDISNPKDIEQLTALYERGIRCMDSELKNFLERLTQGLKNGRENIIIVTADHGESLGEHQLLQHGNMYDENIKIPLIISLPNTPNKEISTPIRSIDILPTVLDYLKIVRPVDIDGESLLALIHSSKESDHFKYAFSQHKNKYAVYKNQFKFIHMNGSDELYDLSKDPEEKKNIINEFPEVAFELKDEFFRYSVQTQ